MVQRSLDLFLLDFFSTFINVKISKGVGKDWKFEISRCKTIAYRMDKEQYPAV